MSEICRAIAHSARFQSFVTWVIILAGVLVGIETYPSLVAKYGDILHTLDKIVLGIFVLEIAIKMIAEGKKPWRFFYDNWNVFDFLIVAAAFMPISGQYVTVLRLARLLRVLRLVRALPKLQLLVSALLKSIPSMAYVSLLLFMLFYVYAVAGVFLFSENDPVHFRNLQISFLSLFRAVTLEDWTDLMYIQMYGCDQYGYGGDPACTSPRAYPVLGALFFVSFVLIGTMVVLNLFIGVIMNGMTEAQKEAEEMMALDRLRAGDDAPRETLSEELAKLERQLLDMQALVQGLSRRARLEDEASSAVDAAGPGAAPAPAE